jgi:hypothetical protein
VGQEARRKWLEEVPQSWNVGVIKEWGGRVLGAIHARDRPPKLPGVVVAPLLDPALMAWISPG